MELYLYLFFRLYPIFLVFIIVFVILKKYKSYIQYRFWINQKKVLLKISMPREIEKTPAAMESFFDGIYDAGREGGIKKTWLVGSSRPEFSFEMVSIEGSVYFFIWTEVGFKDLIKRTMFANYPGVEIVEVLDYTKNVTFDPEKNSMFSFEYKLAKADPYPIKTYKDFGLDKGAIDDMTKTDPLSMIIESLAGVGANQQIWLQFVIRGHAKDNKKKKPFLEYIKTRQKYEKFDWKTEAKNIIKELEIEKEQKKKFADDKYKDMATKREKEVVNRMVENVSKTPYEVGIRAIYIAPKEYFKASNITILGKIFRPFASEDMNMIVPSFATAWDYNWQDLRMDRMNKVKKQVFSDYRRRIYSYSGRDNKIFLMKNTRYQKSIFSSEELATLYHIPTKIVENTKIDRAGSKSIDAPRNLPV